MQVVPSIDTFVNRILREMEPRENLAYSDLVSNNLRVLEVEPRGERRRSPGRRAEAAPTCAEQ